MANAISPEQLLGEAGWLRRLAARLADDRDDADDLAQEAWIAAWRRQPDPSRPLRPWLAKVVRDAAKMRRRATARRAAREASAVDDAGTATPEELLAQARLHHVLVELVLDLAEPYRGTVLARYVDGKSSADIARAAGIPEATVRWRLAEALKRLREQLDERAKQRAWMPLWMTGGAKATVGAAVAISILFVILVVGTKRSGPPTGPQAAPITPLQVTGDSQHPMKGDGATVPWLTPADASTSPIAGRVIDDRGAPIAGALIELQSWPTGGEEATATTASDGRFRFQPRWAATYVVTASAARRAPSTVTVDPRAPRDMPDPAQLTIVLSACAQAAEGTVVDTGGGPIAGARVQRITTRLAGPYGPSAVTGSDGRYAICLPRGVTWLDIGADGYEHVGREITARDGRQRVDVALAPGASLVGQVVDAASGEPVSGVWVGLWPMQRRSGEGSDRRDVSAADGRFSIDGLSAGRYMLAARDGDHVRSVIDELDVLPASRSGPLTIRLERGVDVRGVVRAAGEPVANVRVQLGIDGDNWGGRLPTPLDVVTTGDGAFTFRGVPRGAALVPKVIGYAVRSPAKVDATARVADLIVEVEPLPVLRGQVLRHGVPVIDADVTAFGGSTPSITARTDATGRFSLVGITTGTHKLSAVSERAGAFSTAPITVTVPSSTDVTIELDGGATITGVVHDEAGAPIVGAEVIASDATTSDGGSSVTAVDGAFSIDSLAGGTYTLRVKPYAGATKPLPWAGAAPAAIELDGGDARGGPVTLAVRRLEDSISGVVLDDAGVAVADAVVRLGPVWGWTTHVPIARTDTSGRFRFSTTGEGPFTVDAGRGAAPLAIAVDVAPGTTDLTLRLVRPGAIRGTLVGLPDARIWARRVGGIDGAASVLAKDRIAQASADRFGFDGLVPGEYLVLAINARTTASARVQVLQGETASITLSAGSTRRITGGVTRFGAHTPVGDLTCVAVPATGDALPAGTSRPGLPQVATTRADGSFTIEEGPAGEALVLCFGSGYATGATVAGPTGDATMEVVAIPPETPTLFGFSMNLGLLHAAVELVDRDDLPLRRGDRIIAVDGVDVRSLYSAGVYWLIAGRPVGDAVRITFDRDGTAFDLTLTVEDPYWH